MSTIAKAQFGKSVTTKRTFSRETTITAEIKADANLIWKVLTDSENYPEWNSTIISFKGKIAPNEKIILKSTLDEKREFKLKVKEYVPNHKLVWGDANGKRTFLIELVALGRVHFTMHEKIGGIMFPLYAKMIPSFDENFEQFVKDLKTKVESKKSKKENSHSVLEH
ncbi:MAG: SRPBCC domain-containing protein [Bacteroidota bacterium]